MAEAAVSFDGSAKRDRRLAMEKFILMLAEKMGCTLDDLLDKMRKSRRDNQFEFTLTHTSPDEFAGLAKEAFGEMVSIDTKKSAIRIDDVFFDIVVAMVKKMKMEAAPTVVPMKEMMDPDLLVPSHQQMDGITKLIFALCDVAGVEPLALPQVMHLDYQSQWTNIRIKNPAFKEALRKAKDVYLKDSEKDSEKAEIIIEGNYVFLNRAAANSVQYVSEHIPAEVEYTPSYPPFHDLKVLLSSHPGIEACFNFVAEIDSRGVYTVDNSKHNFSATTNMDGTVETTENQNNAESEQINVVGVEAYRFLRRDHVELVKEIREAFKAINTAQRHFDKIGRVNVLGLKLDTVRSGLKALKQELTNQVEGAHEYAKREFDVPPNVMEWLDKAIDAMDEQNINDEISARRKPFDLSK